MFGAIIFSLLEEKPEQALKVAVRERRLQFLLNNSCLQGIYIVVLYHVIFSSFRSGFVGDSCKHTLGNCVWKRALLSRMSPYMCRLVSGDQ